MTLYAIVEKATGKIVRIHAHYVFGNAKPVDCSDEEIQAAVMELGEPAKYEVHKAPDSFDPADRTKTLLFDSKKNHLRVTTREQRKPKQGRAK